MKILLFGGSGYIGSEFINQFQYHTDVELIVAPSRQFNNRPYPYVELERLITRSNVQAVINCAAYVGGISIIGCETRKEETITANVIFPRMLAEICQDYNIVLGHMSSACLYNGYPPGGYIESDEKMITFSKGCSFYTGTKSMAEDVINEACSNKYIWRIRLPFDQYDAPRNYLSKLMKFDRIVNAQNSLSNRKELVNACISCIMKKVPYGTYHVTNPGSISAEEIVTMVKDILKPNKEFKYYESPEAFDKMRGIITSNTHLNCDKLASVGIKMSPVHESVEWSLKNWKE